MKKRKSGTIILALFLFLTNQIKSQYTGGVGLGSAPGGSLKNKIALNAGKISNLKNLESVNIIYSYEGMGVNTFRKEEEYFEEIKNFNKKTPDLVEIFLKHWVTFRKHKYEPEFENAFNKYGAECNFAGKNYSSDAELTLKVETTHADIYYPSGEPDLIESKFQLMTSTIDVQFTFIDKNGVELARFFVKNAIEMEEKIDFISPDGIGLTKNYDQAAKILIRELAKRIKHKKIKTKR